MATTRKPATTRAKATAKAVAKETAAEPTVEEKRERRAELIDQVNKESLEEQKKEIAEQKAAGQGPKIDDDGAIEQQRVARESHIAELTELGGLEGPPVVAPVIESGPSIKLVSRRDEDITPKAPGGKEVDSDRFVGNKLWVEGEGFFPQSEVIIDVRREDGSDHARFSYWAETPEVQINLPGLSGPGDWLVHLEQSVTTVGEGRADGQQRILESNELTLDLR